jgi:hypothetical protein
MCSCAGWIGAVVAWEASVPPELVVATVYAPLERSTFTWAVAIGLIGPVHASAEELAEQAGAFVTGWAAAPFAGRIVSDSAWLAWLVTMKTIGPAPTELGDSDTRWSLM